MQSLCNHLNCWFLSYEELLEEWQFSPSLMVVYMKKHVAIVTAKPVVN